MPMLPIPAFVALVLGYLAMRNLLSGGRLFLVVLLATCALQSMLVTLVGGYGFEWLRPILPVSAAFIPALAWVTFQDAMVSRISMRKVSIHAVAPAFVLFCRIFAPETTDVIIALIFAGYGTALLMQLRGAADMPLARLDAGHVPAAIWKLLGWALIASAVSDVFIAAAFITGHAQWVGWMITVSSSLVLLCIGLLSNSPVASGAERDEGQGVSQPPETNTQETKQDNQQDREQDGEIIEKLEMFLQREPMHLDPNLTLVRLARRMHLPQKRLSQAVNRATGSNVSRYINSWRIRHACTLIESGMSITDAMFESGFNTKSNFNREFLRETGKAPSTWQNEVQALKHELAWQARNADASR